jgi:hypothetical protein
VPGPDRCLFLAVPLASLAYVGLGPGQAFFAYFLVLAGWVAAACIAVLQWPLLALRRRRARARGGPAGAAKDGAAAAGAAGLPQEPDATGRSP